MNEMKKDKIFPILAALIWVISIYIISKFIHQNIFYIIAIALYGSAAGGLFLGLRFIINNQNYMLKQFSGMDNIESKELSHGRLFLYGEILSVVSCIATIVINVLNSGTSLKDLFQNNTQIATIFGNMDVGTVNLLNLVLIIIGILPIFLLLMGLHNIAKNQIKIINNNNRLFRGSIFTVIAVIFWVIGMIFTVFILASGLSFEYIISAVNVFVSAFICGGFYWGIRNIFKNQQIIMERGMNKTDYTVKDMSSGKLFFSLAVLTWIFGFFISAVYANYTNSLGVGVEYIAIYVCTGLTFVGFRNIELNQNVLMNKLSKHAELRKINGI